MRTQTIFATVGVLLLCLCLSVCDRCDTAPDTNGCSIPGGLSYFYSDIFKSDCNKHDVCYSCGANRRVSRRQCDGKLWDNTKQTCRTDSNVRNKVWCNMVTFDYYTAVRIGGRSHYKSESPYWCSQSWVSQCLG